MHAHYKCFISVWEPRLRKILTSFIHILLFPTFLRSLNINWHNLNLEPNDIKPTKKRRNLNLADEGKYISRTLK